MVRHRPRARIVGVVLVAALLTGGGGGLAAAQVPVRVPDPRGVETFPEEGTAHVEERTTIEYKTSPPTSGPHGEQPYQAGFYALPLRPEGLVHNLEHGNVVIYYSRPLPAPILNKLRDLASQYRGPWDGVLVVPWNDSTYSIILTAWTKRLRLRKYDEQAIQAFLDAYRGRGPEKPVR